MARIQNILDNSTMEADTKDGVVIVTCTAPNGTSFLYLGSVATEPEQLFNGARDYFRQKLIECENYLDNDKKHYGYDETDGDCLDKN